MREHRALGRLETVDARGQHRLDRRRQRRRLAADRHELLEEQRVALAGLHAPRRERSAAGVLDELVRLVVRARRARAPTGRLRRRPGGPRLEQLRACEADEQNRGAAREHHEVLEQVQQRRLRPVDVLDDDDERTLAATPLEHPANGPERLLGLCRAVVARSRRAIRADQLAPARRRRAAGSTVAELRDDLGERAVGHAVAVRRAGADEHGRVGADRADRLVREPRLADPRRADDREPPRGRSRSRGGERVRAAAPSSRARPTNGRRVRPRAARRSSAASRHARRRAARPARRGRPARARPRRAGSRPSRRASSSRAATANVLPAANRVARAPAPTNTSPASTPSRSGSPAARISTAARTARSASSSRTCAWPKTPTTASPA